MINTALFVICYSAGGDTATAPSLGMHSLPSIKPPLQPGQPNTLLDRRWMYPDLVKKVTMLIEKETNEQEKYGAIESSTGATTGNEHDSASKKPHNATKSEAGDETHGEGANRESGKSGAHNVDPYKADPQYDGPFFAHYSFMLKLR